MTENNRLKGVFKGEERVHDDPPRIACLFHGDRSS